MSAVTDGLAAKLDSILIGRAASGNSSDGNRAPPQGGVIEGLNPSEYNPKDPIILFIIQASLILIVCHALHWPLSKIRQPRVIAEVIGGIILGPSVMGHVPGFRDAIFPADSIPLLSLVANLGLVLYLFLIGLETDVRFLLSNWRVATSVAVCGLAVPFGFGCAIAWGLYNQFKDDEGVLHIGFGVYMLFIGVAIAITAFPVLCRILTELKLLDTPVGIITLSAGVANDVVGWILLALCVTLVNAGNGLTALYIFLACTGYVVFLLYPVKRGLMWVLRHTGSIDSGPSQTVISMILLLALASAFFTGIIGVHAIFGGFLVGLILPREGRFNIIVTEKLEDLIGALFLPLYFTLSGLNTDIGLLNSGIAWGYVVAVTVTAFFAKFFSATLGARLNGLVWRESMAIGVLMSCKGLVELIVLNIGLAANILSTRTFTIFVVMALITTFISTPLASYLYPPWYQTKIEAWKRGEIDWDTGLPIVPADATAASSSEEDKPLSATKVNKMLVYLRLDNLPAVLGLVSLFGNLKDTSALVHPAHESKAPQDATEMEATDAEPPKRPARVHGLRLMQLTDRDSSFMTVAQVDEFSRHDPVVNTFCTVGQLHHLSVSGEVAIMPETRFAEALVKKAGSASSDLLFVPWSETGSISDAQVWSSATLRDKLSASYAGFVREILDSAEQSVAVFFSRAEDKAEAGAGSSGKAGDRNKLTRTYSFSAAQHELPALPPASRSYHVFFAYVGGRDDRVALGLVMQLSERPEVTATIARFSVHDGITEASDDAFFEATMAQISQDAAPRVKVENVLGHSTVEDLLAAAAADLGNFAEDSARRNVVVVGRNDGERLNSGKLAPVEGAMGTSLGGLAGQMVGTGLGADLLVVQAGVEGRQGAVQGGS